MAHMSPPWGRAPRDSVYMPGRPGFQGGSRTWDPPPGSSGDGKEHEPRLLAGGEARAHAQAPAEHGLECIAVCSVQLQRTEESEREGQHRGSELACCP